MADADLVIQTATLQVKGVAVSLADLLRTLSPQPEKPVVPTTLPLPSQITPEEEKALDHVKVVFAQVVPTEKRSLTQAEIESLMDERVTLDALKAMAEKRISGIRTTIFNHLDVEAERGGVVDSDTPRDASGNYIFGGIAESSTVHSKRFTREVRNGSPSLNLAALHALEEDPDSPFTHEDYLAVTVPAGRVLDEAKLMKRLKRKPELLHAIRKAMEPGSKTASFNVRPVK